MSDKPITIGFDGTSARDTTYIVGERGPETIVVSRGGGVYVDGPVLRDEVHRRMADRSLWRRFRRFVRHW